MRRLLGLKPLMRACMVTCLAIAPSAHALCMYKGELYAETTIPQEFRDSTWVVHAKLIAEDDHWSDEDESYKLYHLQVIAAYKGRPPLRIDLATAVNSGGYYLDDLGDEYLLYLDPVTPFDGVPIKARHAMEVNYNCGRSKAWKDITKDQMHTLDLLAGGKPRVYPQPFPTDERGDRR